MKNKLIPILVFIVSLEVFFLFNGFTSTAFWYQLGRFGLSSEATFLLFFGTLAPIFLLITVISAAYIIHKRILKIKSFYKLTIVAFYLGGLGFWLYGFIPVFSARDGFASIGCSPANISFCLGLPSNIFIPFVYINIIIGLMLIYIILKKSLKKA